MMTREEILSEPVGRRLDAWVHEHVMGGDVAWAIPYYSDSIGMAWMVVEKLSQTHPHIELVYVREGDMDQEANYHQELVWILRFTDSERDYCRNVRGVGSTPALAVCRAALLAMLAGGGQLK